MAKRRETGAMLLFVLVSLCLTGPVLATDGQDGLAEPIKRLAMDNFLMAIKFDLHHQYLSVCLAARMEENQNDIRRLKHLAESEERSYQEGRANRQEQWVLLSYKKNLARYQEIENVLVEEQLFLLNEYAKLRIEFNYRIRPYAAFYFQIYELAAKYGNYDAGWVDYLRSDQELIRRQLALLESKAVLYEFCFGDDDDDIEEEDLTN